MRRASAARAGFTMLELLISVVLLSLVLASTAMVSSSGYRTYRASSAQSLAESHARRALERAVNELRSATADSVPDPGGNLGMDTLTFRQAIGVDGGGNLQLGGLMRLAVELDPAELANGLDDDDDGLADEGELVLTRDVGGPGELRVVLARPVRALLEGEATNLADDNGNGLVDERGFCVQRVGRLLTLRLSIEDFEDSGRRILRTVESSIRLRN
jgi:prepilin-type N-terminal cleavage/methylation domain-containing protein